MGVGALLVGRGTVTPVSSAVSAAGTAGVRLRLKPANVQAAVSLRAAGARRFAFNWALAQVKANQDQWAAEATYDIPKGERTRPSRTSTWSAAGTRPGTRPRRGMAASGWTFRYGIRAAHTAHSRFLKGQSRFPRFKARHRDRPRFTTADRAATAARSPAGRQVRVRRPSRAVDRKSTRL